MSVDESYSPRGGDRTKEQAEKIFSKSKVNWPNVFEPDGWNGVMRRFNASGYGLILVDPDGIVRGVDQREAQVEKLLRKIYPKSPASQPADRAPASASQSAPGDP